jgi:hypothetical protein
MIDKKTIELAKKLPTQALAILRAFRNDSDRERAKEQLRANGVVLDWAGHHPENN